MATKERLCIQGAFGVMNSHGPGHWLGGSRLRVLLPRRVEGLYANHLNGGRRRGLLMSKGDPETTALDN